MHTCSFQTKDCGMGWTQPLLSPSVLRHINSHSLQTLSLACEQQTQTNRTADPSLVFLDKPKVLIPAPRGESVLRRAVSVPASAAPVGTSVARRSALPMDPSGCRRTWVAPGPNGPAGGCPKQRSRKPGLRSPRWSRCEWAERTGRRRSAPPRRSRPRKRLRPGPWGRTDPAGPRWRKLSGVPVRNLHGSPPPAKGSLWRISGGRRWEWRWVPPSCRWRRRSWWRWAGGPGKTEPGCRLEVRRRPLLPRSRLGRRAEGHAWVWWRHLPGWPGCRQGNSRLIWLPRNVLEREERRGRRWLSEHEAERDWGSDCAVSSTTVKLQQIVELPTFWSTDLHLKS